MNNIDYRVLRVYGRSYSQKDINGIGQEICKNGGVEFKYSSIDGYNNAIVVVGFKNGQEVKKRIYFNELGRYKLISRVNEQPYYDMGSMLFYRDELEEVAKYFVQRDGGKYIKFNVSHKNNTLIIYARFGLMPEKLEISLYDVDRYLQKGNHLFHKPY